MRSRSAAGAGDPQQLPRRRRHHDLSAWCWAPPPPSRSPSSDPWPKRGSSAPRCWPRCSRSVATVIPLYLILRALGLRDSLAGLVLPYTTFALPLDALDPDGFFRAIPDELYRAAIMDGCSPFQAFRRVQLPLVLPGLADHRDPRLHLGLERVPLRADLHLVAPEPAPCAWRSACSAASTRSRGADRRGLGGGHAPRHPGGAALPALARHRPDRRRGEGLIAWPRYASTA